MIPYRTEQRKTAFPKITLLLIAINLAVFYYEFGLSDFALTRFINEHGLTPGRFEPLDMISTLFIHGGWIHVLFNMLYLYVFGSRVEHELRWRGFITFYFCAGLVASLTQMALDWNSLIPQIGASGAVAGVLGASLRLNPKAKVSVVVPIFIFFRRMILPAWLVLISWFGLQVLYGYLSLQNTTDQGIAFFAHIGGFVFGLILAPLFKK